MRWVLDDYNSLLSKLAVKYLTYNFLLAIIIFYYKLYIIIFKRFILVLPINKYFQ